MASGLKDLESLSQLLDRGSEYHIMLTRLVAGAGGNVAVVDAAGILALAALSGDATLAAGGALTIANLAINPAKLAADAVETAKILANAVTSAKVEKDLIQFQDTQVTNAQILALLGTDIVLVSAPGANRANLVESIYLFYDATGAYTIGTAELAVGYGSDGVDIQVLTEVGFVDQATDQARIYNIAGQNLTPVVNETVVLRATVADLTGGNAANTISIRTYYREVDIAAFT